MPSRSDPPPRRLRPLLLALIALVLLGVPAAALASVIGSDIYLLGRDEVVTEDLTLAATTARVEGTIDGDLVVAAGSVELSGRVTGDMTVLSHGSVTVSGVVEGSLRGVVRRLIVTGSVGDDLTVAALSLDLAGEVGRDVAAWSWRLGMTGEVGRDILGRFSSATVAGSVGHDVDVAVSRLSVAGEVGGDVVYRSSGDASIDPTAVDGQVVPIPVRAPFMVAMVMRLLALFGLFGFIVGGIVALWLFDATAGRAVEVAATRPWPSMGVGLAALVLLPVLFAALVVSLVGIPLALAVLLALVVAVAFGSVPLVTAVGSRLLAGRGGVFGGLVLGAVIWAAVAVVSPLLGAVAYTVALVWGLGAWLMAGWQIRRARVEGVSRPA